MKDKLYWHQAWQDNLIETLMIVLMLAFLAYVVKLAFFEDDLPVANDRDQDRP
ncbi:hypothetical protein [Conchiformibius kuhniae]|uniref:Uncharacterized protein n=1 Tax=Conchiformibius kuhniae TaxID=211502 RepID=A0A8T9MX98_9NEIS|nr:hypothetical protein [Conchiformibius kuhniae]UOP04832.1 hypothetical protein LVJ77_00060 [Conchiformibius kuhniae]